MFSSLRFLLHLKSV